MFTRSHVYNRKIPLYAIVFLITALASGGCQTNGSSTTPPLPDGIQSESAPLPITERKNTAFTHYGTDEGLSNNIIWSIVQDSKGLVWIGTADGLNRFDGYEFKVYKHDPENSNSLTESLIYTLYEDSHGELWIGTWSSGLNRFDRATERFTAYTHDPDDPTSLSNNLIRVIYEDQDGTLWIGTEGGGLNRFEPESGQFTHYMHDPDDSYSISSDNIFAIHQDHEGMLWIGTFGSGLNRFDPESEQFTTYTFDENDPASISGDYIMSIYEDRQGILWIGTWLNGLNRLDPETLEFTHYQHDPDDPTSLSHNQVQAITEDRSGMLWMGTEGGGACTLDRDSGAFTCYQYDSGNAYSLSHNQVRAILEDQEGTLWFGTFGGGINLLDWKGSQFTHFHQNLNDPNGLSGNQVRTVYQDQDGVVWIGTEENGLNRLEDGEFTVYRHDENDPNSLSNDAVWSIIESRDGSLWIGTYGGGLNRLDRETGTFESFHHDPDDPNSLSSDAILTLYEDSNGDLWIGTFTGLTQYEPDSGQFTRFENEADAPNSLSNNFVTSIYKDSQHQLWIGTFGGLNAYNESDGTFTHYHADPDDPDSLSHNNIAAIYEDSDSNLWVGTVGGGLNRFDRESQQFIHYQEADGLPSDSVLGIMEDDAGNLWLTTFNGLSRFDRETSTFRNYDESDGIQGNQFNSGAYYKSATGEMFVGGSNGFTSFFPDDVRDSPYHPPVIITNFLLSNKPVAIGEEDSPLQQSIMETDTIELSYNDRVISFEFAALSYQSPKKNRYMYILDHFEDTWNEVDSNRRFATYTNLDAGEYVFRVIGSNSDGIWNTEGEAIKIVVKPPWWDTVLFKVVVVITLIGSAFGIFFGRLRNVEKQKQELEKRVRERTSALSAANRELEEANMELTRLGRIKDEFVSNVTHELRTPITSLKLHHHLLKQIVPENNKNLATLIRETLRLETIIENLLTVSRLDQKAIPTEVVDVDINALIEEFVYDRHLTAENKGLRIELDLNPTLATIKAHKGQVGQVMSVLLTNAINYTPVGGTISIQSLTKQADDQNWAGFSIRDTGPGIHSDEAEQLFTRFYRGKVGRASGVAGTGLGLSIAQQIMDIHHGTIEVNHQLSSGVEFVVWFPVNSE